MNLRRDVILHHLFVAAVLLLVSLAAISAERYLPEANEIFTTDKDGVKRIMLPPVPVDRNGKRVVAKAKPLAAAVYLYMIQTFDGLIECSEPAIEQGACRPSSIGNYVSYRTWVVRRSGKWLHCAGPAKDAKCWAPPAQNGNTTPMSWDVFHTKM